MVSTVQELEACIGVAALPAKLKSIDHMEEHAAGWIAASPLMSLVVRDRQGNVRATLGGDDPGFAVATTPNTLTIKASALDRTDGIAPGDGIAALFVAPGVTETLRVAGRVADVSNGVITLDINECFVHCGKALIRSQFWQAAPQAAAQDLPGEARILILGTSDAQGNADASPKGDPAGFIRRLTERTFALPDRTGNRRADGHRNILAHDRVSLVAFAPGATQAFELTGSAQLTNDTALLAPMSVQGKAPPLATLITADETHTYDSGALQRARIWDADRANTSKRPHAGATITAHIKAGQQKGVIPAALRFAITAEGTEKALKSDYKANLY
ncbi:MAG: pyridoxamine 5'-phosphate oxidase family protein [Alphaproteobacteria bacterium]|nr:pyridoxamine 5'-phosphate oxidase family protein [Alphaproteobacteria bacterium]